MLESEQPLTNDRFDAFDSEMVANENCCTSCLTRVPYATLIAFIMNVVGLAAYAITTYRGLNITKNMLWKTFQLKDRWPDVLQLVLVTLTGIMVMYGLMVLFVGFLATGSTRRRVYRHLYSRVAGRVACAIFLAISYLLTIFWLCVFAVSAFVTYTFVNLYFLCRNKRDIDLTQFRAYFPDQIDDETLWIRNNEIKEFCTVHVKHADVMFIFATFSCLLIIVSMIHYIICLAANYTHIRSQEKIYEIQELHYLSDPDMPFSKDRF